MHVVKLLPPQLSHEDHTNGVDFTPAGTKQRCDAGYAHTKAVLVREPWADQCDPLLGATPRRRGVQGTCCRVREGQRRPFYRQRAALSR